VDALDRRLVAALVRSGRATWADLAHEVGISAPAVAGRVQRLIERGVIVGFSAVLNPRLVAPVAAFVAVRSEDGAGAAAAELTRWPEVVGLHRLAAEDDLLLTVRCRSLDDLNNLVGRIAQLGGVARASTRVVLDTLKETLVDQIDNE